MKQTDKTVCFTGHRKIIHADIEQRLIDVIETLIEDGFEIFQAGGAIGFDTIAAQTVLKLKKKHANIKLFLALPFVNQPSAWSESDRRIYKEILNSADKYVYISELYARGCFHKRNRYMVDTSSLCVAYMYKKDGGTAYTVDYAMQNHCNVVFL